MEAYLDSWDGQPVHVKEMIKGVHAALGHRHFQYEDLVEALEARGFHIDPVTFVASKNPRFLPKSVDPPQ
jgi:hypothetical protein